MSTQEKHSCTQPSVREVKGFDAASLIGTPFSVHLENGVFERYCPDCGKVFGHVISKPKELIACIAILRTFKPTKLSGEEIKFLRKSLGLKAKQLADEISISSETLSRFENNKQPISEAYEKLLRAAVCLRHIDEARGLDVDIEGLFSMKIESVHDSSTPLSLSLCMVNQHESQAGDPLDTTPQKWHLRHQERVA